MMRSALHIHLKLQDAVSMNQQGVALLESCHSCHALQYFQGALQALHEIESTRASSSESATDVPSSCLWSGTEIPQLHDDLFFVYNQALLVMPPTTSTGSSLSLTQIRVSLAAVCFNMGLAFHLQGLHNKKTASSGTGRRSCHEKAALCYSQALQYLEKTCEDSPEVTMMTLLALNNVCQIHYQLRNLTQLQSGLEQIRKLSLSMLLYQPTRSSSRSGPKVLGELMINVLVSTHPGAEGAAAA